MNDLEDSSLEARQQRFYALIDKIPLPIEMQGIQRHGQKAAGYRIDWVTEKTGRSRETVKKWFTVSQKASKVVPEKILKMLEDELKKHYWGQNVTVIC